MRDLERIEYADDHTTFHYRSGSRTLCVVDDDWIQAARMFKHLKDPFDPTEQAKWATRLGKSPTATSLLTISMLPVFCRPIVDLGQLILMDFPAPRTGRGFLSDFVEREAGIGLFDTGFLIDLWAEARAEGDGGVAGDVVIPILESRGIPLRTNVAFLTAGARSWHKDIEVLVKGDVYIKMGQPIVDWWGRVQGNVRISEKFFHEVTTRHLGWHDPSTLTTALEDPRFLTELVEGLSHRDKFGVWRWILRLLQTSAELNDLQYAFLCGKAFLKCGGERTTTAFTALRGLARGLRDVEPKRDQVQTRDEPDGIPAEFLEDMDNTLCLGQFSAGLQPFWEFARRLRDWLTCLESDTKGSARLATVLLRRGATTHELELTFTRPLGEQIFAGTSTLWISGDGLVTGAWKRIRQCFNAGQTPEFAADHQSVTFRFAVTALAYHP